MKNIPDTANGLVPPGQPPATHEDVAGVMQSFVKTWREIDAALSPVFGSAGVAALGRRCLSLACARHPWLITAFQDPQTSTGLQSLGQLLAQQDLAEATRACETLLQTLRSLLASLVGTSLTERLLRPVQAMGGPHVSTVQEPTP